jgi:hypothetical protein
VAQNTAFHLWSPVEVQVKIPLASFTINLAILRYPKIAISPERKINVLATVIVF